MVICAVISCSARSERDKWLSFHRFPVLTKRFGEKDFELRKKRLDGYLAAISREDIDPKLIKEHDYRICSRHFVLGKPAKLYKINSPNWLPTLHLGHTKQSAQTTSSSTVSVKRYETYYYYYYYYYYYQIYQLGTGRHTQKAQACTRCLSIAKEPRS